MITYTKWPYFVFFFSFDEFIRNGDAALAFGDEINAIIIWISHYFLALIAQLNFRTFKNDFHSLNKIINDLISMVLGAVFNQKWGDRINHDSLPEYLNWAHCPVSLRYSFLHKIIKFLL